MLSDSTRSQHEWPVRIRSKISWKTLGSVKLFADSGAYVPFLLREDKKEPGM